MRMNNEEISQIESEEQNRDDESEADQPSLTQVFDDREDSRSEYEISMRNQEWNMLSESQRKCIENLHLDLIKSKREFEGLQLGRGLKHRNKIFLDFLAILEKDELKSISPEILMTTKFGYLLTSIKHILLAIIDITPSDVIFGEPAFVLTS